MQAGTENLVEIIALILLPVAILMCAYALVVFIWRAQQIEKKHVRGVVLIRALCCWHCRTTAFHRLATSMTARVL